MNEICGNCPFSISLAVAEQIVNSSRANHRNPDEALGGIALTRNCLDSVVSAYGCSGPQTDSNGQWVCPIRDTAMGARAFSALPWPKFDIDTKIAPITDTHGTGQYL